MTTPPNSKDHGQTIDEEQIALYDGCDVILQLLLTKLHEEDEEYKEDDHYTTCHFDIHNFLHTYMISCLETAQESMKQHINVTCGDIAKYENNEYCGMHFLSAFLKKYNTNKESAITQSSDIRTELINGLRKEHKTIDQTIIYELLTMEKIKSFLNENDSDSIYSLYLETYDCYYQDHQIHKNILNLLEQKMKMEILYLDKTLSILHEKKNYLYTKIIEHTHMIQLEEELKLKQKQEYEQDLERKLELKKDLERKKELKQILELELKLKQEQEQKETSKISEVELRSYTSLEKNIYEIGIQLDITFESIFCTEIPNYLPFNIQIQISKLFSLFDKYDPRIDWYRNQKLNQCIETWKQKYSRYMEIEYIEDTLLFFLKKKIYCGNKYSIITDLRILIMHYKCSLHEQQNTKLELLIHEFEKYFDDYERPMASIQ